MPFDPGGFDAAVNELLTFTDPDEVGGQTFKGFPADDQESAEFMADVFVKFFENTAHPPQFALNASIGRDPFITAYLGALGPTPTDPPTGAAAIIAGATAFALALVPTSLPAFVAIPPAAPLVFVPGPPTNDPVEAAEMLVDGILTWAGLGFADPPPPTGTPMTTAWM